MSSTLLNTIRGSIEDELRWRWHFADGEITNIPSHAQAVERKSGDGEIKHKCAFIRTVRGDPQGRGGGGITEDVGLRCGPVFVESPIPVFTAADIDWRQLEASVRARRIDAKLRQLDDRERLVLWLALGARPRMELLQLGTRCNLLALTSAACFTAQGEERSIGARVEWLERLAAKICTRRVKQDEKSIVLAMQREAEAILAEAGRAYGAAWG